MRQLFWNIIKFVLVFVCFTSLFYVSIRYFHAEYENQRLYKEPEGRAVKVFNEVDQWIDRVHIFIRTGE